MAGCQHSLSIGLSSIIADKAMGMQRMMNIERLHNEMYAREHVGRQYIADTGEVFRCGQGE